MRQSGRLYVPPLFPEQSPGIKRQGRRTESDNERLFDYLFNYSIFIIAKINIRTMEDVFEMAAPEVNFLVLLLWVAMAALLRLS